jgi:integrase
MTSLPATIKENHPPPTLSDAFSLLIAHTKTRVTAGVRSPATLAMQLQHVRYFSERLGPAFPLEELTAPVLEELASTEGMGRRVRADGQTRPLSGGTVRKRLSTLHRALRLSCRNGWIEVLPEFPEVLYVYKPSKGHLPTLAEYRRLFLALPAHRREWLALAVWTGQRHSDVERMVREDFDPRAPTWVRVRSWKTRRFDGIKIAAAAELVRVLRTRWLLLSPGARLVEPWPHASSQLGDTCARIGLPRLTAQSMRHTFFTWYVAANGFTPELLELGGWSSLKIPSLVYAHARPARFRAQIARTALAAQGPRRRPRKASRKRAGNPLPSKSDGCGAAAAETAAAPVNLPRRDPKAGSQRTSREPTPQRVATGAAKDVGAGGIEPPTNGLRVALPDSSTVQRDRVPRVSPELLKHRRDPCNIHESRRPT